MKYLGFLIILFQTLFSYSTQQFSNNSNSILIEICNNGIDDDDDGLIDCFDDDCVCDDCEAFYYNSCPPDSCTGIPDDFEIKEKWRSGGTQSNLNPPVIGDLDGDGLPEILTIGNSSGLQTSPIYSASEILIYSGDGSNKNNPVRITEQLSGNGTNLLLADLNRDGKGEIVFIDISDRLRFFSNYDGNSVTDLDFSVPVEAGLRAAPNAADFNSDGIPEIYVGKEIFGFDANFTSITKLLEGSGNAIGRREIPGRSILPIAPVAGDVLSSSDCGGDPDCDGLELICGPEVYSVDLTTADGDGFEIKLQRNADNFSGGQNMQDGAAGLADMNLDGTLEVIVNGAWEQGGTVTYGTYIYSPSNSTIYLRSPSLGNNGSTGSLGKVSIGNVFDDSTAGFSENYPEVIAVCANWIYTINLNQATIPGTNGLWWSMQVQDPSAITGATSFDFNGDSLSEIVYRDEDNLRIMYGGSLPFPPNVDAQRNWTTIAGGSQTGTEHPIVADVDADGTTEIALIAGSTRSTNGTLRIFESGNQPWIPSRPVWNQQQYFNVNIDDDLTVPPYQQAHQLVGEDLNIFLNQFGDLKYNNEEFERSDTIEFCSGDTIFIQGLPPITRAGIAEVNLSNPNGCDSIITYFLIETSDTIFEQRFESICEGETVNVFGMPVATSGIFTQIDSSNSCLKIETVEVEVNTIDETFDTISTCLGISQNIFGMQTDVADTYFEVNTRAQLCDSISAITLIAKDTFFNAFQEVICAGESIDIFGVPVQNSGFYRNNYIAQNGCDSIIEIELILLDTFASIDSIEICEYDSTLIFGNYETDAGVYVQKFLNINGCDSSNYVFLEKPPLPNLAATPTPSCFGNNLGAGAFSIDSGNPPFTYLWSNNATDSIAGNLPIGTYFLTITDQLGCKKIDSLKIENEDFEITSEEFPPICFGESSGQIEISSNTPNLEYSLNGNAFSDNPVFGNLSAGNYNLAVRNVSGCLFETQIEITSPDELLLSLPSDTLINLGDSILIIPNYSQSPESYAWSPEVYLDCFDCSSVFARPFQTTTFNLRITNDKGCIATDSILIRVEAIRNIYAPSAFSPNDDGINDGFTIFGDATMSNIKELKIFDRWGNFIWEGINLLPNNPSLGWNGKFRDKKMDSAVFAFYAVIEFIDGHQEIVKGDVSLLK